MNPSAVPLDSLKTALTGVREVGRVRRKAWATWRAAAQNARLAAVMGSALPDHVALSEDVITDNLDRDTDLQDQMRASCFDTRHADVLQGMIRNHISWLLHEVETGLMTAVQDSDPRADFSDLASITEKESRAAKEAKRLDIELREKLDEADAEADRLAEALAEAKSKSSLLRDHSQSRTKAISLHSEQSVFTITKAKELSFCDQAIDDVTERVAALKSTWTRRPSEFFTDDGYKSMIAERKSIQAERAHIEFELQSYFDHHAHGATHSETVKPDRQSLKIANDLEKSSKGFKQIQLVDMFCLSRGNEMWAIIADILRIGHDVDPVDCVHWQPPDDTIVDPALTPYRTEQNRAFAQKLLSLVSPGMRSKLLARHKHGVSKREVKASEHDGCMIYWVMLQLYHPLSRDYRRTLELKLNRYHSKFSSGDPTTPLTDLQADVQEALDLMLRVRWDTAAIPIIDTLGSRDALFQVELSKFRELPDDPDDSAVELDQLCSHIASVIEVLNTAKKNWDQGSAMSVQKSEVEDLRNEVRDLHAMMSSGNHPNPRPKNNTSAAPKEGYCQVVGCGQKIAGYKKDKKWKLCSTCLLKVRSNGKALELTDGSWWGNKGRANAAQNKHSAKSILGIMKSRGVKGLPKTKGTALSAAARKRARSQQGDPESPSGQDGEASEGEPADGFSEGAQHMFEDLKASRNSKSKKLKR